MPKLPEILSREPVCEGRLFKVDAATLRFSNGEVRDYEYLRSGGHGAVLIVPVVSDNEVLMVQEYGIGTESYEWGFPKGKVDAGESFIEAANRELKEEAGFGAKRLFLLKTLSQSPNYMQHLTQVIVALELYPEKLEGDEPESLNVATFSLDDIPAIIAREDVTEARSIAALFMVRDWLMTQR